MEIDVPSLTGVTVNGSPVTISTGDAALSAIDTGTTLIGGPSTDVAAIKAAVGGTDSPSSQGFFNFRECLMPNGDSQSRIAPAAAAHTDAFPLPLHSLFDEPRDLAVVRWPAVAHQRLGHEHRHGAQ